MLQSWQFNLVKTKNFIKIEEYNGKSEKSEKNAIVSHTVVQGYSNKRYFDDKIRIFNQNNPRQRFDKTGVIQAGRDNVDLKKIRRKKRVWFSAE